jgi:urate oxidase
MLLRQLGSANEKKHEVVEYVICALLEGEIEESYTKSDNSNIVATDSSTYRESLTDLESNAFSMSSKEYVLW